MKKWLIVSSLIAIMALTGCMQNLDPEEHTNKVNEIKNGDAAQVEVFNSFDELASHSPTVVIAQVTSDNIEFEYQRVNFVRTELQIESVHRDINNELFKDSTITLLQSDVGDLDPVVNKNEKVLLFLKKYEGPVINNAYRIVGLSHGHFKVNNGIFVSIADEKSNIYKSTEGLTSKTLDSVLKNNPFQPSNSKPMSEQEIKEQNQREKELEDHDY